MTDSIFAWFLSTAVRMQALVPTLPSMHTAWQLQHAFSCIQSVDASQWPQTGSTGSRCFPKPELGTRNTENRNQWPCLVRPCWALQEQGSATQDLCLSLAEEELKSLSIQTCKKLYSHVLFSREADELQKTTPTKDISKRLPWKLQRKADGCGEPQLTGSKSWPPKQQMLGQLVRADYWSLSTVYLKS